MTIKQCTRGFDVLFDFLQVALPFILPWWLSLLVLTNQPLLMLQKKLPNICCARAGKSCLTLKAYNGY